LLVQPPAAISEIISQLEKRWGLDALWVFGSRATGAARADSDWDLAALFKVKPDPVELFGMRGEFEAIVRAPVDVIDLEQASPVLAHQVVKHGQLVVENNRRRRVDFVAHVPGRYEDLLIIRRSAEQALLGRMHHG
jgi:predicted nucleotidyltransferase